ncbi:MAG: hypothetical protein ACLTGU_21505 [Escherichia coli]
MVLLDDFAPVVRNIGNGEFAAAVKKRMCNLMRKKIVTAARPKVLMAKVKAQNKMPGLQLKGNLSCR